MLNHFLDKLLQKSDVAEETPISTVGAAQKWVLSLTKTHEYDAHQQIIKILKLFNQGHPPFDPQRLHILSIIEQAGSKYQHGLITQFLTNHSNLEYAGKSLWKEIVNFYWQMALSYQVLTNAALHGGDQGSAALPGLVLRSIHYQGKLIQWRYLRYELPTAQIWHSLHKLYRLAEQLGFARESLVLKGSAYCSCEQAYARVLLLHLMHPVGLSPNELELAAYWAWKWRDAIKLDKAYSGHEHTYCVALADSLPPQPTYGRIIALESARYFSTLAAVELLIQMQVTLGQRHKHIKLYGVPFADDPSVLLNQIHTQFTYIDNKPELNRVNMLTEINIVGCKPNLMPALNQPDQVEPLLAYHEAAGHPIEQYYRLNIPSSILECPIQQDDLVLVYNVDKTKIASIAAVRWMELSASKITTLGLEQLGTLPKLVTLCEVHDVFSPHAFTREEESELAFSAMYLSQSSHLIALNAIDGKLYDMLMEGYVYRIRIRAQLEHQYDWLRVKFDMLTRTYLTRLSTSPI